LTEALTSLQEQSVDDIEIIISDNASTDHTAEICRHACQQDPRIRYHRNVSNIGAARNFNRTFALSSGPLFHCAAYDDVYDCRFIERCVDVLDAEAGLVVCHATARIVGERGEPLWYDEQIDRFVDSYGDLIKGPDPADIGAAKQVSTRFRQVLMSAWCLPLLGVIRRSALLQTPLCGSYYGSDKVLLAHLALLGRFHQLPEQLIDKRVHRGCTFYMTTQDYASHDNPEQKVMAQVQMLSDYLKQIALVQLHPQERLGCLLALGRFSMRKHVWRKLLAPARNSYFGWSPKPS
jgi:glycosyltransferase involved in cell wall biosynthesis